MISHHNQFNGGVQQTYVEKLESAADIETEFTLYRQKHNIHATGTQAKTYQSTYWQYIEQFHKSKMLSFSQYEKCKATVHLLKWYKIWQDFGWVGAQLQLGF